MKTKYLLSTGMISTKIELYILDLFKLNLGIHPGDIPHASDMGFNMILLDVPKDRVLSEVKSRLNLLVNRISDQFKAGISITLEDVRVITENQVSATVRVNQISENIEFYI